MAKKQQRILTKNAGIDTGTERSICKNQCLPVACVLIKSRESEGKPMKLLTIYGNSVLNRAFYGIKLLTTKEGLYTNGIYGFLSILLKVLE